MRKLRTGLRNFLLRNFLGILAAALALFAQQQTQTAAPPAAPAPASAAGGALAAPNQGQDELMKHVDDLMWHVLLGDIAEIDKVEYTSLPPTHIPNPRAPGAAN